MDSPIQEAPDGLVLSVRVQPRASRSRCDGVVAGRLRLRLEAPPVEGAANAACVAFLAESLGVPKRAVALLSGDKAREKRLKVSGSPEALKDRLGALGWLREAEG